MSIYKYIILVFIALPLLGSCSKEDDLTPSNADINGFAPEPTDNSLTAQIRNDFYKATGAYLLFNDTLVSKSTNGQPELFDITYAMVGSGSVSSHNYQYTYITDAAKQQQAANALQKYLTRRLGKQVPFSFLLVDDIYYIKSNRKKKHVDYLLGTRGYVISTRNGEMYDDPQNYFNDMLLNIVIDRFNRQSSKVTDLFYAYSKDHYGEDLTDDEMAIENVEHTYGFMEKFDTWGDGSYSLPYEVRDVKDYISAVVTMTRDEFEAKYGDYSVMVEKYDMMRSIITNMGFNLNAGD